MTDYMGFNFSVDKSKNDDVKTMLRFYARKRVFDEINDDIKTKIDEKLSGSQITLKIGKKRLYWPTYLSYLLYKDNKNNIVKDLSDVASLKEIEKNKIIPTIEKYEAFLTQCSYLSRMAYSSAEVFCRMRKFLDYAVDSFNDVIDIVEDVYENDKADFKLSFKKGFDSIKTIQDDNYKKLFGDKKDEISKIVDSNDLKGGFFQNRIKSPLSDKKVSVDLRLGAYIYLHENPESKFNKQKTLYITFKGLSDIESFLMILNKLTKIQLAPNKNFNTNKYRVGSVYHQLLAQDDNLQKMIDMINKLSGNADIIVVTGHSMGGALASLFGFFLKFSKRSNIKDKPIHIITFGEPKAFYDLTRQAFNDKLFNTKKGENTKDYNFTYDAIINSTTGLSARSDTFVKLPPNLKHPGYDLLLKEIKAFSRFGRTNEIGELRMMMGMGEQYTKKNSLPNSPEFIGLFTRINSSANYTKMVSNGVSKPDYKKTIVKTALPDIQNESVYPSEKVLKRILQLGGTDLKTIQNEELIAEKEYDTNTLDTIPNVVKYDCNAKFCTGNYMGVNYMTVLRLAKNNPVDNFELVKVGDRLYSRCVEPCSKNNSSGLIKNNGKASNNVKGSNKSINGKGSTNGNGSNTGKSQRPNSGQKTNTGEKRNNNKPKKSLFSRAGDWFSEKKKDVERATGEKATSSWKCNIL